MAHYIKTDGKEFFTMSSAPFRDELVKAGWEDIGTRTRTANIKYVLPFVKHLEPKLRKAVEGIAAASTSTHETKYVGIVPDGFELFPHQNESTKYILDHDRTLLGDEAGLGKTGSMIAAANDFKPKSILIICPATLKYHWLHELQQWLTYDVGEIGIAEGDCLPATPVIIINYDIVDRHLSELQKKKWGYFICDEAHKLQSLDANRTRIILGNKPTDDLGIHGKKEVFATATPLDRPKHLWPLIRRCDPHGMGKDYVKFAKRYCGAYRGQFGMMDNGVSNPTELGHRIRSTFFIRHNEDVLDLPPMIENTIITPPLEAILKEEQEIINDNIALLKALADARGIVMPKQPQKEDWMRLIGSTIQEQVKSLEDPSFAVLFNEMARIRKETGIAKVPHIIEYVKQKAEVEDAIVIFAYHREVIKSLKAAFPKRTGVIMGGMTAKKKDEVRRQFQEGEIDKIIGNITAMGEGITLTRARYLVFGEGDWSARMMHQAKKRIHRISQVRKVFIDYLLADKSFDVIMTNNSVAKKTTIEKVIG